MKLGRATIYFYSFEDNPDDPVEALKNTLDSRDWVGYDLFNVEQVEIGEFYDSIDLNDVDKCKHESTYQSYFAESKKAIQQIAHQVANIMMTSIYTGVSVDRAIIMVHSKMVAEGDIINIQLTDEVIGEIKDKANQILKIWTG